MTNPIPSQHIRVATQNVFGHHAEWPRRKGVIQDEFSRINPDIVALQEVVLTESHDQARELLGDSYTICHQEGRSDDGYGAVVASKWPIRIVQSLSLQVSERMNPDHGWIGSLAIAEIDVPHQSKPVFLAHLKPSWQRGFEMERELQAISAATAIEELTSSIDENPHVILAGDLDASPNSASIRFLTGQQSLGGQSVCYLDAWDACHPGDAGETFTNAHPLVRAGEMPLDRGRRIDYIMVRCDHYGPTMRVISCDRILTEPVNGVWGSDHFGVTTDLEFTR